MINQKINWSVVRLNHFNAMCLWPYQELEEGPHKKTISGIRWNLSEAEDAYGVCAIFTN